VPIILLVGAVSSTVVALLLERIAYRPLRRAPRLVPLITAIGASLFISNSVRGLYGDGVMAYPRVDAFQGTFNLLGIPILKTHAIVIVSAVVLMTVLYWFVERTRTGRAMRAVSEDKDTAALMGIDVDRIISITFAIGGALAGAAGSPVCDRLQPGHLVDGFPAGDQGLHCRSPGRHRKHRRCDAGRARTRRAGIAGSNAAACGLRRPVAEPAAGW